MQNVAYAGTELGMTVTWRRPRAASRLAGASPPVIVKVVVVVVVLERGDWVSNERRKVREYELGKRRDGCKHEA